MTVNPLATQVDLQADGLDFVPVDELTPGHRYFAYQKTVNAGGTPSEQVIDENRAKSSREYREEIEGDPRSPTYAPRSRADQGR